MSRPLYRLPDKTDKALRRFISATHDGEFKKGMIMNELVKAVEYWIAIKTASRNAHTKTQNIENPVYQMYAKIRNHFSITLGYSYAPQFVTELALKDALIDVGKGDERTIKKWTKLLLHKRCILKSGVHEFEFMDVNENGTPMEKKAEPIIKSVSEPVPIKQPRPIEANPEPKEVQRNQAKALLKKHAEAQQSTKATP
jgi:CO dehydrogenase/acetyl-CoA synthase alpha subunit